MRMKYLGDFGTIEECREWRQTGKMPSYTHRNYLKIELLGGSFMLRALLDYRHVPLYALGYGHWAYLNTDALRNIVPIMEFREKNKPFYLAFGESFYLVKNILVTESGLLELVLEHAGLENLN